MAKNDLEFHLSDTEPQFVDQRPAPLESAAPFGQDVSVCALGAGIGSVEVTRLCVSVAQTSLEELESPYADFDVEWVDAGRFLDAALYWLRAALAQKAAVAELQLSASSWFDKRAVRGGFNEGLGHCAQALHECRRVLLTSHRQRREHASSLVAELSGALSAERGN